MMSFCHHQTHSGNKCKYFYKEKKDRCDFYHDIINDMYPDSKYQFEPDCLFEHLQSSAERFCKYYKPRTDEDKLLDNRLHEEHCKRMKEIEEFHRMVSRVSWEDMNRPFTI